MSEDRAAFIEGRVAKIEHRLAGVETGLEFRLGEMTSEFKHLTEIVQTTTQQPTLAAPKWMVLAFFITTIPYYVLTVMLLFVMFGGFGGH